MLHNRCMKSLVLPVTGFVSFAISFFAFIYIFNSAPINASSVEIGLAELSPIGEAAGYAVPASGSSNAVSVKLYRSVNKGSWSTANATIKEGDQVRLKWTSSGIISSVPGVSSSCVGSGSGFSTGNKLKGTDSSINEPGVGSSRTFKVTCSCRVTGPDGVGFCVSGSSSDSLKITKVGKPTVTLYRKINNGSWSTANATINSGDQVQLKWVSSNAKSCTASAGSGFATQGRTSGTDTSIDEPSAGSSNSYKVTCSDGKNYVSDTITITKRNTPPTATLYRKVNNGSWSASDATIKEGDTVQLKWTSTNATTCTPTGGGFSTGNKTSGTDTDVNEPSAGKSIGFEVTCTGSGGTASDTLVVTKYPVPTATLQVRDVTKDTSWTGSDLTFQAGNTISLKWNSTNSTKCTGSNFSTGNATGGTVDPSIVPSLGETLQYVVSCTGSGGTAYDSLKVTATGVGPEINVCASGSTVIRSGDGVDVCWNSNDADSCTVTGPGLSTVNISATDTTGSQTITLTNESTYTIDCGNGGKEEVTVQVLPVIQET